MRKDLSGKQQSKSTNVISKSFSFIDGKLSRLKTSVIILIICSFVINILLELSLRQSLSSLLSFIFTQPLSFLLGLIIVFATLTFMYFFKKRTFVFFFVSLLWLIIAFVNFYLMELSTRNEPFNISDIGVFLSTFNIIENGYLNVLGIVLITISFLLIVSLLVYSFIKGTKSSGFFGKTSYIGIIAWALMLSTVVLYINTAVEKKRHDSVKGTYLEHGFAFCFLYSMIDSGIDKPANYTSEGFVADRDKNNNDAMELTTYNGEPFTSQMATKELMDNIFDTVIDSYNDSPNYPYLNISKDTANNLVTDLTSRYNSFVQSHSANGEHSANCKTFDKPNIIFLQLESFYDVKNVDGYEYSSDPTPVFSLLKNALPGGKLSVPSLGAGTANTEFEILTGLDKTYFAFTEYPFLEVLQDQTCESVAYNAKEYGYKTHVIHNHQGSFYDRNTVYPNLGFDTFTPIECFANIVTNPRNWCKDEALIEPVLEILNSTENQDLIYTISVQPHGKYPDADLYNQILNGGEPKIKISGNETNPENSGFSYYVNQLNEVDTFVGKFLLELSMIEEPTIVIMYGDHLPSFSLEKYWTLKDGDFFQTDYVIWNNCGIDFSDAKDLKTYQLSSYIFSKIGINSGDINLLNRLYLDNNLKDKDEQYSDLLHTYEYAIFEDKTLRDPSSPLRITTYKPTIAITSAIKPEIHHVFTDSDGRTIILGDNFNEYSKIVAGSDRLTTAYINRHVLITSDPIQTAKLISIQQINGSIVFAKSQEPIIYNPSMKADLTQEQRDIIKKYYNVPQISDNPVDDATDDFSTGKDEFDLIQDNRPSDE